MSPFELKFLITGLIGIDIVIVVVFILLIRRFRYLNRRVSFEKEIGLFESLVADADKMAGSFKDQLEEKHHLVKRLNKRLDQRIVSLNVLLNRADALLSSHSAKANRDDMTSIADNMHQTEIHKLSAMGCSPEEIAARLSIPKGEVKLVLDLHKQFSEIHDKATFK